MNRPSFHILRVGVAITFVWIGILILQNPASWSGYILPWVDALIPISPVLLMGIVGVFDIVIGYLLLINILTWHAALAAALHLGSVLIVSGINAITVRDIGLFAGTVALIFDSAPFLSNNSKGNGG